MTVTRIQILLESLALKNGGRAKMCKEAQEALQLLAAECGEQETLNAVNALLGAEAASFALKWVLDGSKLPQEVKPVDPVPSPAPAPEPIILSRVYAKREGLLGLDVSIPDSWPKKTGKNGKTVNAIVCINGKKFDFLGVGQREKTVANLYGEEYGQSINTGQPVTVSVKDLNGKNETPALPFVWPWRGT